MDKKGYPDILLDPPDKYNKIRNKHGCCGLKPNLYYNGTVHRIWVTFVYKHIVESDRTVTEFLESYGKMEWHEKGVPEKGECDHADEMRESIKQAVSFYEEYESEFRSVRERRNIVKQKLIFKNDAPVAHRIAQNVASSLLSEDTG